MMTTTGIVVRSGKWYLQTIESGHLVDEVGLRMVQEGEAYDVYWVGGPSPHITTEGEFRMLRLPDTPMHFQRVP